MRWLEIIDVANGLYSVRVMSENITILVSLCLYPALKHEKLNEKVKQYLVQLIAENKIWFLNEVWFR